MGQQDIHLAGPWTVEAGRASKAFIARLGVEFLKNA
jgi:hypothetical protein